MMLLSQTELYKHNHPVDTAEIKAHKIESRLKTKAQETAYKAHTNL